MRKRRTDNPFGSERSVITQTGIKISTPGGRVRGALPPAENARSASEMVGGGIHLPDNSSEEIATRLQVEGMAALRLEYRKPNYLEDRVCDVLAGIAALDQQEKNKVALLGWAFGGAVLIRAVSEATAGVATHASQTYGTRGVGRLSPNLVRPL